MSAFSSSPLAHQCQCPSINTGHEIQFSFWQFPLPSHWQALQISSSEEHSESVPTHLSLTFTVKVWESSSGIKYSYCLWLLLLFSPPLPHLPLLLNFCSSSSIMDHTFFFLAHSSLSLSHLCHRSVVNISHGTKGCLGFFFSFLLTVLYLMSMSKFCTKHQL